MCLRFCRVNPIFTEREYSSKNWRKSRDFNHHPYSVSLDNLDPSAKEFLVDAGILLDKSSILTNVSSSMPNLSKHKVLMGIPITTTSADMVTVDSKGPKGVMVSKRLKLFQLEKKIWTYLNHFRKESSPSIWFPMKRWNNMKLNINDVQMLWPLAIVTQQLWQTVQPRSLSQRQVWIQYPSF